MPKNIQTTATITLISHASKIMLKILQGRLQQYVNHELPDVQAGFRKGRGTRDQIANIFYCYAKSLQSCPTLCDPIDGSPPGSTVPGILQARLQQYVNHELPDVQAEFRKGRGTRDQVADTC